jgi:hypothetical protein
MQLTFSGDVELGSNGPNRTLFPVVNNVRFAPPCRTFSGVLLLPGSRHSAVGVGLRHRRLSGVYTKEIENIISSENMFRCLGFAQH